MSRTRVTERIAEEKPTGGCGVCGSTEVDGYMRVVYDTSNLTAQRATSETQHECFDCHQEAKSRDRKRARKDLEPHLV